MSLSASRRQGKSLLPALLWGSIAIAAIGLLALGTWAMRRGSQQVPVAAQPSKTIGDPRSTFDTPYRNVRPDVKYVGDEACARCHESHAKSYHQHPMGRSFSSVDAMQTNERYARENHNPFQASHLEFVVERRADRVVHKALRKDGRGKVAGESDSDVRYAVGAGTRGYSYLIERDGYLFQSPISWYADRKVWYLSPHLGDTVDQLYRPVNVQCLFCHSNHAESVDYTVNRYRPPIFRGQAIGCERCHGPGELHAALRNEGTAVTELDDTIVNPGRLSPTLREAVCQQCHLEGITRVLRFGRRPFDYRPGLPLHLFWSVFVRPHDEDDHHRFASHVDQMYASRCFKAGDGKLGCISCHDPHELPLTEKKAAYYRDRCLQCHGEKGCSLPAATRRQKTAGDNCIACHMARIKNSDIAHMASTDHRILRHADDSDSKPGAYGGMISFTEGAAPDKFLVPFYRDLLDPLDKSYDRDHGIALMDLARMTRGEAAARQLGITALPLLEKAVQDAPDDVLAWQEKGFALWAQGRKEDALAVIETALAKVPQAEESLLYAAKIAAQLGRYEEALDYRQRLLAVNPWPAQFHFETAKLLVRLQDPQAGLRECRKAIDLDPFHLQSRILIITCHLVLGEKDQAKAELDLALRLHPQEEQTMRNLFGNQLPFNQLGP